MESKSTIATKAQQTLTKERVKHLTAVVNEALAAVGRAEGVVLKCGGGTFFATEAKLGLHISLVREDGLPPGATRWAAGRAAYGLSAVEFGSRFTVKSHVYEVADLAVGRSKFPIIGRRVSDGKMFKFQATALAPDAIGGGL